MAFQVEEFFPVQPAVWRPCNGFDGLHAGDQQGAPQAYGPAPQYRSGTVHPESHLLYPVHLCPGAYRKGVTPLPYVPERDQRCVAALLTRPSQLQPFSIL